MGIKDYIIYSIFLFLIIFNPPIIPGLSFTVLFVLLSSLVCVIRYKDFFAVYKTKGVKKIVGAYFVFFGYNVIFSLINYFTSSNELILNNLFQGLWTTLSLFAISTSIVIIISKKKASFDELCNIFILAGLLQMVIGVLCLVNPSAKEVLNSMVIANSGSERIREIYEISSPFRHFGFAATTFDIFGATMSILAVITAKKGLQDGKPFYFMAFLVSVVAIINARTSFFLILIGLFVLFLSQNSQKSIKGKYNRIIIYIILIVIIVEIGYSVLQSTNSEQVVWLLSAVEETQSLSHGSKDGYFDTLFNEFLFFPSNPLQLFFGTGLDPEDVVNHGSDVGYVKYIWAHGIAGSILLYRVYIIMFKTAIKNLSWPDSSLISAIRIMVIVYLVKLTCLGYSMASVVFVPLCFYAMFLGNISPFNVANSIKENYVHLRN